MLHRICPRRTGWPVLQDVLSSRHRPGLIGAIPEGNSFQMCRRPKKPWDVRWQGMVYRIWIWITIPKDIVRGVGTSHDEGVALQGGKFILYRTQVQTLDHLRRSITYRPSGPAALLHSEMLLTGLLVVKGD
jgi:hypothetical protein